MPKNEFDEDKSSTQATAEDAEEMPSGDDFIAKFADSSLESFFAGSQVARPDDDDVIELTNEDLSDSPPDNST